MAELVRVRIGDRVKNVGAAFAAKHGLEVVEESPRRPDDSLRPIARANGRRTKKKTSVAQAAAEKQAAQPPPNIQESSSDDDSATAEEATK